MARVRPKIMVADDDAGVRKLLRYALEGAGFEVFLATNGLEASQHFRDVSPELLITDLAMPEQEGLETMRIFRSEFPNRPAIVMSGAFAEPVLRSALYLGASAVLEKPVRIPRLIELVHELVSA
jgi:CheY-like chemotaxis protein